MSDDRRSDYEVGYKKPPERTRFKKGESGNRNGRPKGTKNLKTDLLEELGERMEILENGKTRRISKQRALIKSLLARALKGNDRAAAKLLDLYLRLAGLDDDAEDAGLLLSEDERAVMKALEERLLRGAGLAEADIDRGPDDDGDQGLDDEGETP